MTTTALDIDLPGKSRQIRMIQGSGDGLRSPYPIRDLNGWMLGRCPAHPNEACDCEFSRPAVASCGSCVSSSGSVLVEESSVGWSARPLSTCKSKWACDFCAPRLMRDDRAKAEWLLTDHLVNGGRLLHLTLTASNSGASALKPQLDALEKCRRQLFASKLFTDAGVLGWVRVIDVTYPESGWHPHFHTMLLLPAWFDEFDEFEAAASKLWRAKLSAVDIGSGRRAAVLSEVGSIDQALYPWRDEPHPDLDDFYHPDAEGSYQPEGFDVDWSEVGEVLNPWKKDRPSFSPWEVGSLASMGDRKAQALWAEWFTATKGRSRVSYSKNLNAAWKKHLAEVEPEPEEETTPVAVVASSLWQRAHRRRPTSVAEVGLRVGRRDGLEAMARFWSTALSIDVDIGPSDAGVPFIYSPSLERTMSNA